MARGSDQGHTALSGVKTQTTSFSFALILSITILKFYETKFKTVLRYLRYLDDTLEIISNFRTFEYNLLDYFDQQADAENA
ncbi:Protein CBG22180 [Caenorhabditis briggsae]|uniref:Protein CBG22180 n=1 Tax=Caenorhabditis briggsae TaxID=6238 RepID=A8Y1R0_CAEBR|nr:Protein CBG22180 [Caenorhabditis briggsae]CAP38830.1 Protein CBG22180 [Caenorhabditis briggsae]